jgi:hypothetical protein
MNTRKLAEKIGCQSTSIHARYCRTGSFHGVLPEKLPNGCLIWPDDTVERLIELAKRNGIPDRTQKAREVLAQRRAAAQADNASSGG